MVEKRSKYDTDPLDGDFVRRTDEIMGGATNDVTRTFDEQPRRAPLVDEPTRRFDDVRGYNEQMPTSYPSVFVPPQYQPPQAGYPTYGAAVPPATPHTPSSRSVAGIGIPEKWAMMLPYAPFYIGAVLAVVELLVVPRGEVRTRFNASQALALHLVIFAVGLLFRFAAVLSGITTGGSGFVRFGAWIFSMAAMVFLFVQMSRAWKGNEPRIDGVADIARQINHKIDPRN